MNSLTVKFKISDRTLTAMVSGEIDHHSVKAVREEIDRRLLGTSPKTFVLDLQNVGFMDSSGLGLVLGRYEKCKAVGAKLIILNPSAGAERVLYLAGIEKIIEIQKTSTEVTV